MACRKPLKIYDDYGYMNLVVCGQCMGCRIRRRYAWIGRLKLEMLQSSSAHFWTLTYPREVLADDATLDYSDLQKWLKAMRNKVGRFRFFAVGEYGDKFGRGHWHLITFGTIVPYGVWHSDGPYWPYRYQIGSVTSKSISYCAAYCTKQQSKGRKILTSMSRRPGLGMASIGAMAKSSAKYGIAEWPNSYKVGNDRYPLLTGGLSHFKSVYLANGGVPPASLTPYERDIRSRASLAFPGTRLQMERLSRLDRIEDGSDPFSVSQK